MIRTISVRTLRVVAAIFLLALPLAGTAPMVRATPSAPITVTTTADEFQHPGAAQGCSLREAIQAANTNAAYGGCPAGSGDDVIELPAGTYTLDRAGASEDLNATGDLDISSNITLNGGGQANTTLNGGGIDRIIDIRAGTVVINDLTITSGQAPHGGPGSDGAGAGASGGTAGSGEPGGGIRNLSSLTLSRCTIRANKAGSGGTGGKGQDGAAGASPGSTGSAGGSGGSGGQGGAGGGIHSTSQLTVSDCTIDANQAGSGGSGGQGGDGGDGAAGIPGGGGGRGGMGGSGGIGGGGGGISATVGWMDLSGCALMDNQAGAGGAGGQPGVGGDGGTGANGGMGGLGGNGGQGRRGGAGGGWLAGVPVSASGCTVQGNRSGQGGDSQTGGLGGEGGAGSGGTSGSDGGRGGDGGLGQAGGDGGRGGGIAAYDVLTLTLTTVIENVTGDGGTGGDGGPAGDGGAGGAATVAGDGGIGAVGGQGGAGGGAGAGAGLAINLDSSETLYASQCAFEDNSTGDGGPGGAGGPGGDGGAAGAGAVPGAVGINGNGRDGGAGGSGGPGGGLFAEVAGQANVSGSTFYANSTGEGARGGDGGASGANQASLAPQGGQGGDGATGGSGGSGAGIRIEDRAGPQPLYLDNCTVHDNETGGGANGGDGGSGLNGDGDGGDGGSGGYGGGIGNSEQARLMSLTITENSSSNTRGDGGSGDTPGAQGDFGRGGGIWNEATLYLGHTLLAQNHGYSNQCFGTLDSLDYNWIYEKPVDCTVVGDTGNNHGGFPYLDAFGDNGGPTKTYGLKFNSQAIDSGAADCVDTSGAVQPADQRGFPRPVDGGGDSQARCDIGAVEMQGFETLTVNVDGEGVGWVTSNPVGISCTNTDGTCPGVFEAGRTVTLTANPASSWDFLGWSGDCSGKELKCGLLMDETKTVTATLGLEPEPPPDDKWKVYLPMVLKE